MPLNGKDSERRSGEKKGSGANRRERPPREADEGEKNGKGRGRKKANAGAVGSFNGRADKGGSARRSYTAEYKVNRSGELLDFLLAKCDTSRNNVKTLLSGHFVLINGSVVTRHNLMLAKDDEVKISKYPIRDGEKGDREKPKRRLSLKILYEDDDFVAVDKPAGLLSVESDKESQCAFAYVLEYLAAKGARPFILHRIDKETSGVLMFAKNVKIHSMLKMKWNEYVKTREYYAVIEGKMAQKEGTIVSFLKENKNNLVYSTRDPSGQKAVTHYVSVRENAQYSLLRVTIDTGRKNQIRVQLKEAGHPVVGDEKYEASKNPLGRLGLHASKLEFSHPLTGEEISVGSPLPPSFKGLF